MGNGLIYQFLNGFFFQFFGQSLKPQHGFVCPGLERHHKTAVSKSLMRIQHIVLPIGRKQGYQLIIVIIKQKRTVLKTVSMVIHIASF